MTHLKLAFWEKKVARRRRRKKYGIYRTSESVFRVENMFKSCKKPKNFGACGRQILLLTSNYNVIIEIFAKGEKNCPSGGIDVKL